MVAVICPGWADLRDADGNRRLDSDRDYVRFELAEAFKREIPVIPVLVDGARMPNSRELPDNIALLRRPTAELLRGDSFDDDADRIARRLQRLLLGRRKQGIGARVTAGLAATAFMFGVGGGITTGPSVRDWMGWSAHDRETRKIIADLQVQLQRKTADLVDATAQVEQLKSEVGVANDKVHSESQELVDSKQTIAQLKKALLAAPSIIPQTPPDTTSSAPTSELPAILMTSDNRVPNCVTPNHLLAFARSHNKAFPAILKDIANSYQRQGESLRVRWDFAFYQMLVVTNFLTYVEPWGQRMDLSPEQNNFAGLGTTGNGVKGENFQSMDIGVQAHLEHLLLYSGYPVDNPVSERTRIVTSMVLPKIQGLGHPATFRDLAQIWVGNGAKYAKEIQDVADEFQRDYCGK